MTRAFFSQRSFLGGEWAATAQGQSDSKEYQKALKECTNMMPLEEGSITRRPGMFNIAPAISATDNIKIHGYTISDDDAYVLEFTSGLMRVYTGGDILLEAAQTVNSFSAADPAVVNVTTHNYLDDEWVKFTPTAGTTAGAVRNRFFIVDDKTASTFTLDHTGAFSGDFDGADLDGWTGGTVQRVFQIVTPYGNTDIPNLKFTQDDEYLYIFHPDYVTQRVARGTTDFGWTIADADFTDGPYLNAPENVTTMTPSGTSGTVTITASSITDINGGTGFLSTDVGRWLRLQGSDGNWTKAIIATYSSTTSVTATIQDAWNLADTTVVTVWRLGVFSDTDGWPAAGTFHEGRLMLTGAVANRVDGSRSFEPLQFQPTSIDGTVADDNGITYLLNAEDKQDIYWIVSDDRGLILGTLGGEWVIRASSNDDPLTPTSVQARRKTKIKSADVAPVTVGTATIFVQKLKRRLVEYSQFNEAGSNTGYDGINLSRFAKNFTESGVEEIAYQSDPFPTVWVRRGDGQLVGFGYKKAPDQSYVAWHHDPFDTSCVDGTTAPAVLSITVGTSSDGLSEELYAAVHRTVNGVGVISIEHQAPLFDSETTVAEDGFFVGDGIQYSQADFDALWHWTDDATYELTFFGLWAIEGECVDVMFRGADLGEMTVTNGQIVFTVPEELSEPAADATYGTTFTVTRVVSSSMTHVGQYNSTVVPSGLGGTSLRVNRVNAGNFQYVDGEDGIQYHLASANFSIHAVNVDTGVSSDSLAQTTVFATATTNGINPLGGITYTDGGVLMNWWPIPHTAYFWTALMTFNGSAGAALMTMYKINSSGNFEFVGQFFERNSGTSAVTYFSHVHGCGVAGTNPLTDKSMVIHSMASASDYRSLVVLLPSVSTMVGNIFSNSLISSFEARQKDMTTPLTSDFLNLTPSYRADLQTQRGCIIPTVTGALITFYVGYTIVQAHINDLTPANENAYITSQQGTYPNGFICAIRMTYNPMETGGFSIGSSPEILNADFTNSAGAVQIPFDDVGEDVDGSAGGNNDDYFSPSVINNGSDPVTLIFPRTYSLTDTGLGAVASGSYAQVRSFSWDLANEKAIHTASMEGAYFDTVTDVGGTQFTSIPQSLQASMDPITKCILLAAKFTGVSSSVDKRWVYAKLGNFEVGEVVTLDTGAVTAIGLGYTSRLQLLRPEMEIDKQGIAMGKLRRVDQVATLLWRSGPFKIGTDFINNILLRLDDPLTSGVQPLFSGVYQGTVEGTSDMDGEVTFEIERPFPMTLLSVTGWVDKTEG